MAELTADQKELASLRAANAALEAEKAKLVEAAKGTNIALPVTGSFTASVRRDGKTVEVKYGFKDGFRFIRDEKAIIYPADVVMKIAKGDNLAVSEAKEFAATVSLTRESAQVLLQRLADLGYFGLVESK
jgi:hypothetical protein